MMSDETRSTFTRVTIPSNEGFLDAIEQYIDDNKPDPLSLKQLRGLSLDWRDDNDGGGGDDNNNNNDIPFQPSHVLQGTLHIGGEYLVVNLDVTCAWSSSSSSSSSYGKLYYSCHASARFWTKSEWKKRLQDSDDNDNNNDSSTTKTKEKIRSKMIKRLQNDSYISKILINNNSDDDHDDDNDSKVVQQKQQQRQQLLAQAKIHIDEIDLEERVDVSESICESIKRSIWSNAESQLDIIDLILQFPCLPTTSHSNNMKMVVSMATNLANRAKLRLLEDAMVDACEQEGEDQILEDLEISSKQQQQQEQQQVSSLFNNKNNKNNKTNKHKKGRIY